MVNNPIDMKYTFKRERYLEKRKNITESAKLPDLENVTGPNNYNQKVSSFIRECTSYKDAINILETLYLDNKFDLLEATVQTFINDIIPLTENQKLSDCISYASNANIGDINKDRIIEAAKTYKTADRIIRNHNILSKRFSLDSMKGKSDRQKAFHICEMVCTYNQPVQSKFNIAIEETKYLDFLNGGHMSDTSIVENVSDYFLMIEDTSKKTINSMANWINESKVLSGNAADSVPYLMGRKDTCTGIRHKINEWKMDSEKSIDGLSDLIKESYNNVNSLNLVIDYMNEFADINEIDYDVNNIFGEIGSLNATEARNLTKFIEENNISNSDDLLYNIRSIWEAEVNDSSYNNSLNYKEIPANKVGKIRLNNLIADSQNVGEFLDHLEKTSMKEAPIKLKKILTNHIDHLSESTMLNNIDANGFITLKLRSYMIENGNIDDISKLVKNSINCINNILYNRDSFAYYSIDENTFDINLRSRYKVTLTDVDEKYRSFAESDLDTISKILFQCESIQQIAENSEFDFIINKLQNDRDYAATVTVDEFTLIQEMLNPYMDDESSILKNFVTLCDEEANPDYDKIKNVYGSINEESFDPYDDNLYRIHLCYKTMNINEEAQSKESTPDENKNKSIKSLNDIKLAWYGVKSKMKNVSAKEQEISRDIDVEFNHLLKTISNAGPDHREEIITGEVNRSLSKVIKMAVSLAGAGAVAGGIAGGAGAIGVGAIVAPVIGLVSYFAKSKYTSTKEKKMILDEIDIELQVLEREINRAEQSGSTKKYRQLLTIQKNLQRKRQEIYYGLAKKGKRIPMQSTVGMRTRE